MSSWRPTVLGKSRVNLILQHQDLHFAGSVRESSEVAQTTGVEWLCAFHRRISNLVPLEAWETTGPLLTTSWPPITTRWNLTLGFSVLEKTFPARPTEFSFRRQNPAAPRPSLRRPATNLIFFACPRAWPSSPVH